MDHGVAEVLPQVVAEGLFLPPKMGSSHGCHPGWESQF